ncbi:MAG: hypothetical protein QW567_03555 [Candidatus Hadarchaeales archaeon]
MVSQSSTIEGEIEPQPSKYLTLLSCALASLCPNKSVLESPLVSRDTSVLAKACETIGCILKRSQGRWSIWGVERGFTPVQPALDLKGSETAISIMSAVATFSKMPMVITGDHNLCRRPMPELLESLRRIGIKIHSANPEESPPFMNFGGTLSGGRINLRDIPHRFIPPALLAAPFSQRKACLLLRHDKFMFPVKSMLELMKRAGCTVRQGSSGISIQPGGYRAATYRIPKDLCSTIAFLVASGISGSRLMVKSGKIFSERDELLIHTLRAFGMKIRYKGNWLRVEGGSLKGTRVDISWAPELFPFIAVLSCYAKGTTRIEGASEARGMRTDRVAVILRELKRMGASALDAGDSIVVKGPCKLKGCQVDGQGDHAVAAALTVAGLGAEGKTLIKGGADAIGAAYSKFVSTFKSLGANIGYSG